jgi:UDP-glucose 4-epimerase
LTNDKISVYGDGYQCRDFTFISDIIDANIMTLESEINGNVLNIGIGSSYSVKQSLELIEEITGIKNQIVFEPPQKGDIIKSEADITNAKKIIRYNPKVDLNEGLIKQISWTKGQIECRNA